MKLFVVPILLLLASPLTASAEWYWLTIPEDPEIGEFTELNAVEYAVAQIPKDQLQAVGDSLFEVSDLVEDSDSCVSKYSLPAIIQELRKYDAEHDFYTVTEEVVQGDIKQGYTYIETSTTTNQSTIDGREKLINSITTNANSCLEQEKAEREKKEREEQITKALETCDFDFFENEMTNAERMDSWNERQECNVSLNTEQDVVVPPVIIPSTEPKPVIQESIPLVVEPVITPGPVFVPGPEPIESENDDIGLFDSTTTTTTPTSTTEQTYEEVAENDEQTESRTKAIEPENRPSFLGRVANFFRNLFSW